MAETPYPYTIATDFSAGKVDPDRLGREIVAQIATALVRIDTDAGICTVVFAAALTAPEKTSLDGDASPPAPGSIIWDHTGAPVLSVPSTTFMSSADSATFTTPAITVPLDSSTIDITGIVDTPLSLAANEVTALEAGIYDLIYDVLIDMTSGSSAVADAWLEQDPDGQGFVEVASSRVSCTVSDGPNCGSAELVVECVQNAKIRIRAERMSGNGTLIVRKVGIRLTVSKR